MAMALGQDRREEAMRPLIHIEADLASLDAKRRLLIVERDVAIQARNLEMLRLWDDEHLSFNAISRRTGLSFHTVKMFLWNRGRTVGGRRSTQAQMAADLLVEAMNND